MQVGIWQIGLIVLVIILLFGSNRIAGLGKSMGEAIRGFKKGIAGDDDSIDVTNSDKKERRLDDGQTTRSFSEEERAREKETKKES